MPLPRALGRFNRRVTNPILWPVARHLPGFARIVHVGRRSSRTYRTPLLVFRRGDRVVVALTYGPNTDWARNVAAAGGATLETRHGEVTLRDPRLFHDPSRASVPGPIAAVLRLIRSADFLEFRVVDRGRNQDST